MFFLGLLSTPLPYLLLAAFYFFGFAMGMFNNQTSEDSIETVASVNIPAEIKQKTTDNTIYYYQEFNSQKKSQTFESINKDIAPHYNVDTGPTFIPAKNSSINEFQVSVFLFSRPPPSVC